MGTNFNRIPTVEEMERRREKLIEDITKIDLTPGTIEMDLRMPIEDSYEYESPWDVFLRGANVHVGKRSGGWKFLWNFHDNKYYSNKEELLAFIRSGRIVNEYGEELPVEEFIEMALNWNSEDGIVFDKAYEDRMRKENPNYWAHGSDYYDRDVDGLRVATYSDFC
jgi:hypothetical protein